MGADKKSLAWRDCSASFSLDFKVGDWQKKCYDSRVALVCDIDDRQITKQI